MPAEARPRGLGAVPELFPRQAVQRHVVRYAASGRGRGRVLVAPPRLDRDAAAILSDEFGTRHRAGGPRLRNGPWYGAFAQRGAHTGAAFCGTVKHDKA